MENIFHTLSPKTDWHLKSTTAENVMESELFSCFDFQESQNLFLETTKRNTKTSGRAAVSRHVQHIDW